MSSAVLASASPPYPSGRRFGFNLVESAIVLGVIGLVIGGIWTAASAMQSSFRQGNIVSALLEMSLKIGQAFPRGVSDTGVSTPAYSVEYLVYDFALLVPRTSIPATLTSNMGSYGPLIYKHPSGSFYLAALPAGTFTQSGSTYDLITYEVAGISGADCRWLIDWIFRHSGQKLSSVVNNNQNFYIQVGNINGGIQQAGGTPASVALANNQALCTNNGLNVVRVRVPWPY